MQSGRFHFGETPTRPRTPSKLKNELLRPFEDSPSHNTRSRSRSVTSEFRDVNDCTDQEDNPLQMVRRESDIKFLDWLNDIPYFNKLVSALSVILSIVVVIYWGIHKLISKAKVPKLQRNMVSRISRTSLLVFLFASGFYLLRIRVVDDANVSDQPLPSSNERKDFDSMWMLLQNQINPLVHKLSAHNERIQALENSTNLVNLSDSIIDIKETMEKFRSEVQIKIDSAVADYHESMVKLEAVKENIMHETKGLVVDYFRSFARSFVPKEFESDMLSFEDIMDNMRYMMENRFKSDNIAESLIFNKYGPDYALYSAGATIDPLETTETFKGRNREISKLLRLPTGPELILEQNLEPGHCWPMKGNIGKVTIRLARPINIKAIVISHAPAYKLYKQGLKSAPKDISILGIQKSRKSLLGKIRLDPTTNTVLVTQVSNGGVFTKVTIELNGNWGNPEWTCLYRVAVHGNEVND